MKRLVLGALPVYITIFIIVCTLGSACVSAAVQIPHKEAENRRIGPTQESQPGRATLPKPLLFVVPFAVMLLGLGISWILEVSPFFTRLLQFVSVGLCITFLVAIEPSSVRWIMPALLIVPVVYAVYAHEKKHLLLKRKPSSPDAWVCQKCGEENLNMTLECFKCKTRK